MAYLATEKEWEKLAKAVDNYDGPLGLDSEFEGCQLNARKITDDRYFQTSTVANADIVVWSCSILTETISPRGFRVGRGAVLPKAAILYSPIRRILEDPKRIKPAHNSNVDVHAFWNAGVDVQGIVNTQSLARWMLPGRFTYGLDALCEEYLGTGKTEDFFNDVLVVDNIVDVEKIVKVKVCSCGALKCRLRKERFDPINNVFERHEKSILETVELLPKKQGTKRISQYELKPGHSLWERYVAYAQKDAVLANQLYDWLLRRKTLTEIPWYGL